MIRIRYIAFLVIVTLMTAIVPASAQEVLAVLEEAFQAHRDGEYDKAIALYTQVIRSRNLKAQERAVSFLLRGEAYKDTGKYKKAIIDFTRAIKIKKDYAQAYYFRGLCFEKVGQYDDAYRDVSRALKLKPAKKAYQDRLETIRAKLEAQGGEPSDAEKKEGDPTGG